MESRRYYKLLENYDSIPDKCEFNDSPYTLFENTQLVEYSDKNLFGESYTIVWVVPDDAYQVVNYLLKHIKNEIINKDSCDVIVETWENYYERLCIYSKNDNTEEIKKQISNAFKTILM